MERSLASPSVARARRLYPVALWLACAMFAIAATAASTTGTVIDVRGQTVFIELGGGPAPRMGDLVELSVDVGGDQVVVGTWKITKLSGPVVEAQTVNAQLPAQKGMRARIGGVTATAPKPAAPPKPATPPAQPKPVTPPAQAKSETAPVPVAPPGQTAPPPAAPVAAAAPVAGAAQVQFIKTARYDRIWRDKRSGALKDFAVWRPVAQQDYKPLGDVGVSGRGDDGDRYPPPTMETYLVRNGVPPIRYERVWSSEGSGSKKPFSSWMPVPPEGYRCLGDVGAKSIDVPPALDEISCVPAACVIETNLGEEIWEYAGSGAYGNFSAWHLPKVNTYIGNSRHGRPKGVFYTLSDSCL